MELKKFIAPSGFSYTIREQNGSDDDILSNRVAAEELKNLSNFVSAIVVETNFTPTGKLTPEEAFNLPILDHYCILFQSRIFSLGQFLDFTHEWQKNQLIDYSQDLMEFLFNDYSKVPNSEEINAKPFAIPYYPLGNQLKDIEINVGDKTFKFDLITQAAESKLMALPLNELTKNKTLVARNLRYLVDGNFIPVTDFSLFNPRTMGELRKQVNSIDPLFEGKTSITNPTNNQEVYISILSIPDFFYLGDV